MAGDRADTVTCQACGPAINVQKMMRDEYDSPHGRSHAGGIASPAVYLTFVAATILIVAALAQPWWVGVIGGLVAASVVEMIANQMLKARA